MAISLLCGNAKSLYFNSLLYYPIIRNYESTGILYVLFEYHNFIANKIKTIFFNQIFKHHCVNQSYNCS